MRAVARGIARSQGIEPRKVRALRVEVLLDAVAALPDTLTGARDRAVLLFGWAGAFRRAELVALTWSDLDDSDPRGLVVTVRRSKTDQLGEGERVPVLRGAAPETCPVEALAAWRARAGLVEGALFRRVIVKRFEGSLVHLAAGGDLSGRTINAIVKRAVDRLGLDPRLYGAHSLRRGFATSTARAGAEERAIGRVTRHRSIAVLRGYVEAESLFEDHPARGLL